VSVLPEAARKRSRLVLRIPAEPLKRSYNWLRGSPAGLNVLALAVGVGDEINASARIASWNLRMHLRRFGFHRVGRPLPTSADSTRGNRYCR
jgi:hypothetical protein